MKTADIRAYREERLREQPVCPLCQKCVSLTEATLDHDHVTGRIRSILHRSCNSAEGRILHWSKRTRADTPEEYLSNLLKYWERDYSSNPIHPKHGVKRKRHVKSKRVRGRNKGRSVLDRKKNGRTVQARRVPKRRSTVQRDTERSV